MHHLMLTTLVMPNGATSEGHPFRGVRPAEQRRQLLRRWRCFGLPVCDYFVIGGGRSGWLKESLLGEPYKAALDRAFPVPAKRDALSPQSVLAGMRRHRRPSPRTQR